MPAEAPALTKRDAPSDPPPLSYAQQRLWFLDRMQAAPTSAYNEFGCIGIEGCFDTDVLRRCLTEMVRRHELLRTTIGVEEGTPFQQINEPQPVELAEVDLRRLCAMRAKRGWTNSQKNCLNGRLICGVRYSARCCARDGEQSFALMVAFHHIICDRWSADVFYSELARFTGLVCGQPSPLTELPLQYADYAQWQRDALQRSDFDGQIEYWKQKMRCAVLLPLPTDRPRPAVQSFRGTSKRFTLNAELTAAVHRVSQDEATTPFMTLMAGFAALLHRYTGQDDIVVGSSLASRDLPEWEYLIGLFVNILPFRLDLSGNPSFRELLGRVRRTAVEAYGHRDAPFEVLVDALQPQRSVSHPPLVQVLLVLNNSPLHSASSGRGLRFVPGAWIRAPPSLI